MSLIENTILNEIRVLEGIDHFAAYLKIAIRYRELHQGMVVKQYGVQGIEPNPSEETAKKIIRYHELYETYRNKAKNSV